MKKITVLVSLALVLGLVMGCPNDTPKPEATPEYTVTVENGTAQPAKATEGSMITITANEAPDGQRFKEWTSENASVSFLDSDAITTAFAMPKSNVTVTATYEEIATYTVTFVGGDGTTGSMSAQTFTEGQEKPLTANAFVKDGYTFVNWKDASGTSYTNQQSITPTQNLTLTAQWQEQTAGTYTVTVVGGTGGGDYAGGTTVNITATVAEHQNFTNWTANTADVVFVNANASETTFLMPAQNVTITANLTNKPPVVKGVTISPPSATVKKGESQQFSATVDGLYPPEGGFTVTWALTGNANAGTTLSSTGALTVDAGETATEVTVTATSVQNTSKSASTTVRLEAASATLYTINFVNVPSPGETSSTQYAEGSTVSLKTNQTGDDYRFIDWSATAGTIADDTMRETNFTMPASDVTITANYETIVTKLSASIVGTVVTLSPDPNGTTLKSALHAVVTNANREEITEIHIITTNGAKIIPEEDLSYLFSTSSPFDPQYDELSTISGLEYLDTSNVTSMTSMFSRSSKLTTLALSTWDTSNVVYMNSMFNECRALTNFDVSGWNTSSVENMRFMFAFTDNLTALDLTGWDTSNVTNGDSFLSSGKRQVTLGSNITQIISEKILPSQGMNFVTGIVYANPGVWIAEDGSESATIPVVDGKAVAGTYTAKLAE